MRAFALAAALLGRTGTGQAAEIDAMISTAMKAAIEEIGPAFERASGQTLRVVYGPSGGIARRFTGGEAADLIVVDSKVLDELIKQGKVAPGRTDVARTGIGSPCAGRTEARRVLAGCAAARCWLRNPSATPRRPAAASPRPTSSAYSRSWASQRK
jgi:hypothetical protein